VRLSDFIRQNVEQISIEWEAFAATCSPAADIMSGFALRDHIGAILVAIATDLDTFQSKPQEDAKSKGRTARIDLTDTPAEIHADLRVGDGFTMDQLASEYRALRASVLRLWAETQPRASAIDLVDATRFNEAIDQALAESISRFTKGLTRARDLFLAVIGHDLRNPLSAIMSSAALLSEPNAVNEEAMKSAAAVITRSATRMSELVSDLLELTRTRLGTTIPLSIAPTDMRNVCGNVLNDLRTLHPNVTVELSALGNLEGAWDATRLGQMVSNLVANAIEHGAQKEPVTIDLRGEADEITLSVHNEGVVDASLLIENIENPLVRNNGRQEVQSMRVKLGLYIAREIVAAHGGTLHVTSSQGHGTTFTGRWPRHAATGQIANA
jgi:signal transduction histidine kinase